MPPVANFDLASLDLNRVVVDKDGIRAVNPQRFDMEQIDAVVFVDPVNHLIVGYKDVRSEEFWVRGHMPDYPLLPGVLMCEAAAQLSSFYVMTYKLLECDFMGFGGMENVRFRGTVHPGDRLVLVSKLTKLHRRQIISNVQGFVNNNMVFNGDIIGVPLTRRPEK